MKVLVPKPKTSVQKVLVQKPEAKKIVTPIPVIHQDSSSDSEDEPDLRKDTKFESESEEEEEEEESKSKEVSESEPEEVSEEMTDKKLLKVFNDLYSKFDEDDIEIHNDLLVLLNEMKQRKCITKDEYKSLKASLQKKIQLNM